jgi:toxin ParE1/3/4
LRKREFSQLARADLKSIAQYTFRIWGEDQANRYVKELRDCVKRLSESPMLGRSCDFLRPGYRRMEQGSHVIFYRQEGSGIVVGRILHKSMLPTKHVIED